MPDSESFDAFYARTVGNVTSQMHALAGDDSAADHAIREAYARAYQQWYEIAGYPDTEGWVLGVAREAYQRRRPMGAAPPRDPARPGHDPLSMPGMFRPAAGRDEPAGTGDTTVAPPAAKPAEGPAGSWFSPVSSAAGTTGGAAGRGPARGVSGVFGGRRAATPGNAPATAQLGGDHPAVSGQHAEPGEPGEPWRPGRHAEPGEPWRPGWLAGFTSGRRRPSVTLIALVVVVAIAVSGGVAYLVAGRHPGSSAAARGGTSVHGKPAVRMLAAGRTGSRSAIPWSLIGAGWTLAEVSTAPAGPDPTAAGSVTTYLVDPEGGRYQIQTSTGPAPLLLAWSGNARSALFAVPPGPSGTGVTYDLLSLTTGDMSALPLPPGVTAAGFTRPDGLNILAVSQTATAFQLERFNLQGGYQATIGSLPRKPGMVPWQANCSVACGALSSPDGLTAVWGIAGAQMQLLGNAGGPVIRRLDVPDSGSPPSCVPLTWWNAATVLAYCSVTGHPHAGRLWLVPTDGTSPTAVTGASGSGSGAGVVVGAWQLAGRTYVNSTNFAQCAGAPSGPGGLAVATVSGGSLPPVSIRGTTNNHTTVVSASDGKLLVLAQTSCPSSSSLLWLSPSTGATLTVLSAAASQAGVIAAVPYGNGPTAISAG